MQVGTFENEGNLWGVPYGEFTLYDGDRYLTTLFRWEVAMGDLFIKDINEEVMGGDQAKILAKGLTKIVERHEAGEINET